MGTLKYVYKVARIEQSLIVGISTWLIALLSNGPLWFSTPKVAVAFCMVCSCMGSSLFHYGRRADIYKRKWYDPVTVARPWLLISIGSLLFAGSILIALAYLPTGCLWIAVFNFLTIMLYANFLDQFWPWKNLVIAFVCSTPVAAGWLSGHRMHPIVPYLVAAIYGAYLAREILKDVIDRDANRGKRFTMVMSLGIKPTLRIAGMVLLASVCILAYATQFLPLSVPDHPIWISARESYPFIIIVLYCLGMYFPLHLGWKLVRGGRFENYYRYVDIGMVFLMLATLTIRVGLYN